MARRNKLKTITAYNFFGKKCVRSVIGYTSLNGNELILDLHYSVHNKGKQFVMPEDFDPENKEKHYTVKTGDYIVEGTCEETKKAGIIEAGGFIVSSVDVACESFGTPVIIKIMLEKLAVEEKDGEGEEELDEPVSETPVNEYAAIEEEAHEAETTEAEMPEEASEATEEDTSEKHSAEVKGKKKG